MPDTSPVPAQPDNLAPTINREPSQRWLILSEKHYKARSRHFGLDTAEPEALRLATKAPGEAFYVLQLVAVARQEPAPQRATPTPETINRDMLAVLEGVADQVGPDALAAAESGSLLGNLSVVLQQARAAQQAEGR